MVYFLSMSPRIRAGLIILGALVLVIILAAGITDLELKAGRTFEISDAVSPVGLRAGTTESGLWAIFLRGLIVLGLILVPLYIIYMLIDPRRRKRLLAEIMGYAMLFLMVYFLQNYLMNLPENQEVLPANGMMQPPAMDLPPTEKVQFKPQPTELAVSITGMIIGALVVGAVVLAWWFLMVRFRRDPEIIQQVANEAEETLESLLSGRDFRETILLCYRRMTEVVVKQRGIPREASVTPSEFQQTLIEKGLPQVAVRDLTHIFEDVRYGDLRADEEGRRRATLALRTVIAACRKKEEIPA
jgi:hypothetical protein